MTEKLTNCPVCDHTEFTLFMEVSDHFLTKETFSIMECKGCGFKFINQRPDAGKIGSYYQSDAYISHGAKKMDPISRIYRLARVFSIKMKFGIVNKYAAAGNVLDIGCGTGEFLKYCQTQGFEVAGVEPSEKARHFAIHENKIPVVEKLEDMLPGQRLFNCITLWHVLEHLHDLNGSVEMIRKLLAPGGTLIVAVPNCNSWDAKNYRTFWAAYDVPRHLYHFTETSLKKLMTKHGFEIQHVLPQKLDAYYVSMLSEKYTSGSNNYLKALFNGFRSNMKAGMDKNGHSSQIFVLSRKMA